MPPQKKTNQQVIDEATKAAQSAASSMGGTYTPTSGFQPITPAVLTPAEPTGMAAVEPTPNPDLSYMAQLGKTLEPTETEKTAQSLSDRMLELTKPLAGKDQYQMEQEQSSGLPGFQAQERDLQAQVNALVNESRVIPLQVQSEFAGRGATAGGVAPIQTARLRENAIKALTTNSLLQSVQGNIASAKDNADRAVNLRFAPIEAEMAALEKNLNIIQKSPAYSAGEKKRALEQQMILDQRKTEIEQKKEDDSAIRAMAAAAVKNNPNDQMAQIAAQQVLANPNITLAEAFAKLGKYQSDPMAIKDAILEQEYKRAQIDALKTKSTGGGEISAGEQLYSGLSSPTATAVRSKVSKFSSDPVVTNFSTIQEGYNFAKTISDKTNNPSDDQALIYAFAKVMDPGSVVREGEYATVQKYSQSWVNSFGKGVTQAINGTGFLSDTARANIKKTLKARYEASKSNYDNTVKNYSNSINNLTGRKDGDAFLTDYTNENIQEQEFDINAWIKAPPSYSQDLKMAKEAIDQGEDRAKVKAMMLKKYKTVEL